MTAPLIRRTRIRRAILAAVVALLVAGGLTWWLVTDATPDDGDAPGLRLLVPSEAMEPALPNGSSILVDTSRRAAPPEPGEVIVFRAPQEWEDDSEPDARYVKRVVAVGGQVIECCDDGGRVVVDGKPLDEPYISQQDRGTSQQEFSRVTIPEGAVFVMGDNRNNSADSRAKGGGGPAGTVPVDHIIGRVIRIVAPTARLVDQHNPQR